eukprot:TRINITY_DN6409_c0_g1_i8.p1 TRINITY_DN6409_c0_g1~~TRINITY_DN6409_c0_g1_i8.p1  ORF type:complete len:453 (-),score=79.65 TRINITY_DN6409_c0_g1_i8:22-1380(-)
MSRCISRKIGTDIVLGAKLNTEGISKLRIGYKDGKEYAVKYTKINSLKKAEHIYRLLSNEIETLGNLKDPKVIQMHGYSYSDRYIKQYKDHTADTEVTYCLLSRTTQFSLLDIIYFSKPFNERLTRFYFRQLLSAVRYIHESGYAHRNLKLSNILIDENYNLVVAGFGCAKKLSSFSKEVEECLNRESCMCPESLLSITCDPVMDDLFSLGYLLFTMLIKNPPFYKAIPTDIHYKLICEHKLDGFWKQFFKTKISTEVRSLISSILAYEPIFRPSLCEIESSSWVQESVPTLEEVRQEISELIKTADQRSKEHALNRRKLRAKAAPCKGAAIGFSGYAIKRRGLESGDLAESTEETHEKMLEESKVVSSTHIYTMEHPSAIEDTLSSYFVSTAKSYTIDSKKYKVRMGMSVDCGGACYREGSGEDEDKDLSLIHICRCRRSTLCRSRWSPYH